MKKIAFMALILILSGCATTENYNAILESWIGHNANDLVNSWGYPNSVFEAPNGNTVYVYGYQNSTYIPQTSYTTFSGNTAYTNTTGGYTVNSNCTTYFEVNSQKTIVHWKWKGNACRAY